MAKLPRNKQGANGRLIESAYNNKQGYLQYFNLLKELSISMFEWKNLPETCDERFLELCLFGTGMAIFFEDEEIGPLALHCMIGGKLDVYNIPIERKAYATNGYNKPLDNTNSVMIWNNLLHTPTVALVERYAQILWQIDETIRVNVNAQKTPILISCDETQRLTLKNLYMQYEGNVPVIYGDKNLNPNNLKVLTTGAPYVSDKLYELRTQRWNEILTYLGISNVSYQKKERLISDEVTRSQGGVIASRYSRLNARRQACEEINKMFGYDIQVDFRQDYREQDDEMLIKGETDDEKNVGEPDPMVTDLRTRTVVG